MELPSKFLEQIAFSTRPKIEEHMFIVMERKTHEEHLSKPLQTKKKQFKIAVTLLTGHNGMSNVTSSKNEFCFMKSTFDEDGYIQITIPPRAYEIESLNKEIKGIITEEEHYTKINYPFTIKPNFSTFGSIIEV